MAWGTVFGLCVALLSQPGVAQSLEAQYFASDIASIYHPDNGARPLERARVIYYEGYYRAICQADDSSKHAERISLQISVGNAVFFRDCGEVVVLLRGEEAYRAKDVWAFIASHEAFHALMQLQGSEVPLLWNDASFDSEEFLALNDRFRNIFADGLNTRKHCSLIEAFSAADPRAFAAMARFIALEWPAEFYAYLALFRNHSADAVDRVYRAIRASIGSQDRYSLGVQAGLLLDEVRARHGLEQRPVSGWRWMKLFEKDCGGDALSKVPVATVRAVTAERMLTDR